MALRVEEVRRELCERLRGRREEIEAAVLTRTRAVADPREIEDPTYMQGLRAAISAAVEYGIDALERSEDRAPPLPTTLLSQARLAARNRIPLEIVLRRYFAGYTLLGDFVIEEAEGSGLTGSALKGLLRVQAALFDRLVAAVAEEYGREKGKPGSTEERRAELVKRLLDGELADASELAYEMGRWHLGALVLGEGAAGALRELLADLDCQLLVVPGASEASWLWLGSRTALAPEAVLALCESQPGLQAPVAIGESAAGIEGWRLTHRQAAAALPIALRSGQGAVRYRDVALLASVAQDDLLAASLREIYLRPLEEDRDEGKAARRSLRAYFQAERNVSSAAASLGISRQALAKRLRAAEARVGQPLADCGLELEAALRLEDLDPGLPVRAKPGAGDDAQPLAPHTSHIATT